MMTANCPCQHCNQWLEFQRSQINQHAPCPHCGLDTLLYAAQSKAFIEEMQRVDQVKAGQQKQSVRKKWVIFGLGLLAIALVAVLFSHLDPEISGALGGFVFGGCLLVFAVMIYFLPAIIGRNKSNAAAIFLLNLLLGWTFLGWVVALVWAATVEKKSA